MKKGKFLSMAALALALLATTNTMGQQLKVPAPSPAQTIKQNFALSEITVEYSRPSAKGRTVYGDLVPYGKVWRTGANSATKITFGQDVKVEGQAVSAGTYAIYTIPNKDAWEIMLYKDLTLGGNVAGYKKEDEVIRVKVKPAATESKTETFTVDIANVTATSANVDFVWEKTRVGFTVTADIDEKIMKDIDAALDPADKRPYFQAASYYYENGKDMTKALEWVNKAVEQNPKAFWVAHLKAKIQLKQKDYKGSIATAEQSMALAKDAQNDDYVKLNEKLIEEAKKGK